MYFVQFQCLSLFKTFLSINGKISNSSVSKKKNIQKWCFLSIWTSIKFSGSMFHESNLYINLPMTLLVNVWSRNKKKKDPGGDQWDFSPSCTPFTTRCRGLLTGWGYILVIYRFLCNKKIARLWSKNVECMNLVENQKVVLQII